MREDLVLHGRNTIRLGGSSLMTAGSWEPKVGTSVTKYECCPSVTGRHGAESSPAIVTLRCELYLKSLLS